MNKLILITGLFVATNIVANDIEDALKGNTRADSIPAGEVGFSYVSGAAVAEDNVPIPNFSKTVKFAADIDASMYRSCGQLDTFKNFKGRIEAQAEEKMDAAKEIIKSLPALIVDSAVEYALAKVNPTLYHLFNISIDEYIEMFEIHVKSCEDVREDLAINTNADVFSQLFKVAVADQWELSIQDDTFDNSRRFKGKLMEKAQDKGIKMADGKYYGGKSTPPINFVKSIATAGLNTIAGRNTKSTWESDFSVTDQSDKPITGEFKNADELVEFLEDLYGSRELTISEKAVDKNATKAGVGYYRLYVEQRLKNMEALKKYVNAEITRSTFESDTGILIPPAEIEEIRIQNDYARTVEIEQLSKEKTIEALEKKLLYAKAALSAGINAPDMVQSKLYGMAEDEYKNIYFKILDDAAELSRLKY